MIVSRAVVVVFALVAIGVARTHAQDVTDDGRAGVTFSHPTFLDDVSGAPYIWLDDQTGGVKTYRIAFPNLIYHATPWLQASGGLIVNWKDDQTSGNTRELRPYVGIKVFIPNSAHVHIFEWTRYEWRRTTTTGDGAISRVWRFRTRPGVEFPLSTRAWQPRTFYGLANGEWFVEQSAVDAVRFMSGAGYIKDDRLRLELSYVLELSRHTSSDAMTYSGNSVRLDVKFSFKEGLLHKDDGPE